VLPQDIDIGLRDGVRIQHAVGLIAALVATLTPSAERRRAREALMPVPAPTMSAVR
jgi:hypothetical protein